MSLKVELLAQLSVTAEVCGGDLSEAAAKMFLFELEQYPAEAVMQALDRVRREHSGRMSLAAIISRIEDADESLAIAAWDELRSCIRNACRTGDPKTLEIINRKWGGLQNMGGKSSRDLDYLRTEFIAEYDGSRARGIENSPTQQITLDA